MNEQTWLADYFEANRTHLRGVAYRMLGSLSEAEDAVQEAWLRLSRTDISDVENLGGWLTTVVARLCLDMLRARKARREEALDTEESAVLVSQRDQTDPEHEALLADSVGLALLVVLETLAPAERLAFVLHDLFGLPFDEIAPIVERTPTAARQLASRARRRVQGAPTVPETDLARQRRVVDAFLAAARGGNFEALLAVLDPDVVMHKAGQSLQGANIVARQAVLGGARSAQPARVNGAVGVVIAPQGRLLMVLDFTIVGEQIVAIDVIAEPERLQGIDLAILTDE